MTTGLPDFPVETYTTLLPVPFEAPPLNPSPNGLYAATSWTEIGEGEPSRHLNGVEVKGPNYGGDNAFGIWEGPLLLRPGARPDQGGRAPRHPAAV